MQSHPLKPPEADAWLKTWFVEQVLPLEPALTRYIARNRPRHDEIADIRQEVYERMLERASQAQPANVKAYLFAVARNAIIDRIRSAQGRDALPADQLDEDTFGVDWLTPDRFFEARQELARFETGLRKLPRQCREVVRLRKIEGLSTREAAERLGVGIDAIQHQTMLGMRALVDFLLGGDGKVRRPERPRRLRKVEK